MISKEQYQEIKKDLKTATDFLKANKIDTTLQKCYNPAFEYDIQIVGNDSALLKLLAHYERIIALPLRSAKQQIKDFLAFKETIDFVLGLKEIVDDFNRKIEDIHNEIAEVGNSYTGEFAKINTRESERSVLWRSGNYYTVYDSIDYETMPKQIKITGSKIDTFRVITDFITFNKPVHGLYLGVGSEEPPIQFSSFSDEINYLRESEIKQNEQKTNPIPRRH